MYRGQRSARRAAGVCVICGLCFPSGAVAAVNAAEIRITVTSPTSCEVVETLTVESGATVDHRIETENGGHVELLAIGGAKQVGAIRTIGVTRSLLLEPEGASYRLRYRAAQPDRRAYTCPIWLPALPTLGRPHAIHIDVDLPSGSASGDSMPAFAWTGSHGSTELAHVPSVVRVSYAAAGSARPWSVGRLMDTLTLGVFTCASLVWAWRRRR